MDTSLAALLSDVRRRGSIPNVASTGSADSDLIAHINDALISVAAEVVRCREGFYRRHVDTTLTSTTRYRLPTRAIGNKIASVLLLDSAGAILKKLDEIPYSNLPSYNGGTVVAGYYLEAGDIVLVPVSSTTAKTLRVVYYCRPGQVTNSLDTAAGSCFTITAVSSTNVTVLSGHGIVTSSKVDVIKAGAPHEYVVLDQLPSATTSTTVSLPDTSRVEVGDYLCLADKAPVAQIPDAMRPVLLLFAARAYWQALGGGDMVTILADALYGDGRQSGALAQAVSLLSPRVEGASKKIMSYQGVLGIIGKSSRHNY